MFLFKSPFNEKLIEFQKTLNNRLYNLRHGLTLDGKVQPLPLYASAASAESLTQRNQAISSAGCVLDNTADRLQDGAEYQRRRQEWEIEYKQAQSEINIIEVQLKEQELLIKSSQIALQEAQAQQSAARELYEFITSGFLVVPTYKWLMGRLATLYAPAYDAVLSMCLMAERSWRYDVGDYQRQGFIKTSAWNDSYQGLLAGESLQLDLLQMESAWLQRNERRLNINKTISLSKLLSENGLKTQILSKKAVSFILDSKLFDTNYPGHYLRQIKRISVSILVNVLSPYPALPCLSYTNILTRPLVIELLPHRLIPIKNTT